MKVTAYISSEVNLTKAQKMFVNKVENGLEFNVNDHSLDVFSVDGSNNVRVSFSYYDMNTPHFNVWIVGTKGKVVKTSGLDSVLFSF